MTLKKTFGAVAAAACALFASSAANATPFLLEYTVTDNGSNYRYDFTLTLDNNDGSWAAGQQFDWFSIGNQMSEGGGVGAFGDPVFADTPAGFAQTITSGGANGPTLCWNAGCTVSDGGYQPASVSEALTFSILASTFLGAGELLWSNLSASGGNASSFNVADFNGLSSAVPLPAGVWLFLTGGALLGARARKKAAA